MITIAVLKQALNCSLKITNAGEQNPLDCVDSWEKNEQQHQYFRVRVYVLVGLVGCVREPVWVQVLVLVRVLF